MVKILAAALFIIFVQTSLGAADDSAATEFQSWSMSKANPFYCAMQSVGNYDIDIKVMRHSVKITFQKEGKDLFSFVGHDASIFTISADTLFYVDYITEISGGTVIAIDLATGKKLWSTKLEGAPPKWHSAYSNILNIEIREGEVKILGCEGGEII